MTTQATLRQFLRQLDHQNYQAYKDLGRSYEFPGFTLLIDRIQGDPFAAPSQMRVKIPQAQAGFPTALFCNKSREIGLRDFLTRQFDRAATAIQQQRGSGSSGLIAIARAGQTMLARSAVLINAAEVEIRFVVGLPAFGRRVAGMQAAEMLGEDLPAIVDRVIYPSLDAAKLQQQVETAEDAAGLRQQLGDRGLVAFVANGAVLPRRSGVDDRPLQENCIPFQSPPSLEVELTCPNAGTVVGMGIPAGVSLIVGGGYHGKSTLLRAIELGVYNHVPEDGRDRVVTNPTAVRDGDDSPERLRQRPPKRKVRDLDTIVLDREEIDLSAVEQVVEPGQLRAIAAALLHLQQQHFSKGQSVIELLDTVMGLLDDGFDSLSRFPEGDLAQFRRYELAAALNRWRSLGEEL